MSINRPPLKLLFGTPEFLPRGTVQTTVRVGQKWRDDLKGKVEPRIPCLDLEGNVLGEATVVGTLFGSFRDFGEIGSLVNHQENCRDVDGLAEVLSECYSDFNPGTSQVTILFFKFSPGPDYEEEVTSEEDGSGDSSESGSEAESKESEAAEAA